VGTGRKTVIGVLEGCKKRVWVQVSEFVVQACWCGCYGAGPYVVPVVVRWWWYRGGGSGWWCSGGMGGCGGDGGDVVVVVVMWWFAEYCKVVGWWVGV